MTTPYKYAQSIANTGVSVCSLHKKIHILELFGTYLTDEIMHLLGVHREREDS